MSKPSRQCEGGTYPQKPANSPYRRCRNWTTNADGYCHLHRFLRPQQGPTLPTTSPEPTERREAR